MHALLRMHKKWKLIVAHLFTILNCIWLTFASSNKAIAETLLIFLIALVTHPLSVENYLNSSACHLSSVFITWPALEFSLLPLSIANLMLLINFLIVSLLLTLSVCTRVLFFFNFVVNITNFKLSFPSCFTKMSSFNDPSTTKLLFVGI